MIFKPLYRYCNWKHWQVFLWFKTRNAVAGAEQLNTVSTPPLNDRTSDIAYLQPAMQFQHFSVWFWSSFFFAKSDVIMFAMYRSAIIIYQMWVTVTILMFAIDRWSDQFAPKIAHIQVCMSLQNSTVVKYFLSWGHINIIRLMLARVPKVTGVLCALKANACLIGHFPATLWLTIWITQSSGNMIWLNPPCVMNAVMMLSVVSWVSSWRHAICHDHHDLKAWACCRVVLQS